MVVFVVVALLAAFLLGGWVLIYLRRRQRAHELGGLRHRAQDFLSKHRIALVGFSRRPDAFSRYVDEALRRHGISVLPVNPGFSRDRGRVVYPRVDVIPGVVDGAIIMTPAAESEEVVEQCIKAGITRVWFHKGVGPGSVSDDALLTAHRAGMVVISGVCPMMYLSDEAPLHQAHRWLRAPSAVAG